MIVDQRAREEPRPLRLVNYRLVGQRYVMQPPDEQGRVYLEIAGLWLGIADDHVVCYNERGGDGELPSGRGAGGSGVGPSPARSRGTSGS